MAHCAPSCQRRDKREARGACGRLRTKVLHPKLYTHTGTVLRSIIGKQNSVTYLFPVEGSLASLLSFLPPTRYVSPVLTVPTCLLRPHTTSPDRSELIGDWRKHEPAMTRQTYHRTSSKWQAGYRRFNGRHTHVYTHVMSHVNTLMRGGMRLP